jgi:hypothetical protein
MNNLEKWGFMGRNIEVVKSVRVVKNVKECRYLGINLCHNQPSPILSGVRGILTKPTETVTYSSLPTL